MVEKEPLAVRQGRRSAWGISDRSRSRAETRRRHVDFLTIGEISREAIGRNLLAYVARLRGFRIVALPQRLRVSACDLALISDALLRPFEPTMVADAYRTGPHVLMFLSGILK
jgi:hypothetical protein